MNQLCFGIGDKVVYPNHGVGIIEQISSRRVGNCVEKFYLLRIKSSSLKVMVPFQNVDSVGLRRVVKNGEIQKILDYLTNGECECHADWKYRFKENSEEDADRLPHGSGRRSEEPGAAQPAEAAQFPREKNAGAGPIPAGQRAGHGQNWEEGDVEEELRRALAKCKLRFPEASISEA